MVSLLNFRIDQYSQVMGICQVAGWSTRPCYQDLAYYVHCLSSSDFLMRLDLNHVALYTGKLDFV